MNVSQLAAVLTRILALNVLTKTVEIVFYSLSRSTVSPETKFSVILYLLWAAFLWFGALRIGRIVTHGFDFVVPSLSLTMAELYSVAFVSIGLYFAAANVSPTLSWLYYAVKQSSGEAALSPNQESDYYRFFHYFCNLLIGLVLIFKARQFSSRLCGGTAMPFAPLAAQTAPSARPPRPPDNPGP